MLANSLMSCSRFSATGGRHPARMICQCARHHSAPLANGASCSRSLPMGSPNPSPADGFAKRVSGTVPTSGGPRKCVAVMARRELVRKEGFRKQRAAQGTGANIRRRPNQPYRAGRNRPDWDDETGMSDLGRKRTFARSQNPGPLGSKADPCRTDQAGK